MATYLCPRTDDTPCLHPREVADRLVNAFPEAVVDWDRANIELYERLEELEAHGVHPAIIRGHKNLFGNVAYIEIDSPNNPQIGVRFQAWPDDTIEVESADSMSEGDSEGRNQLLAVIAECLDYDVVEDEE